ncbi:hypothetical protein GCM10027614_00660 [Micromonospora vulcania]
MIAAPDDLTTDPMVASPELVPLRDTLRAGDWVAFRDQLAGHLGDSRTRAIGILSPYAPQGLLESVLEADPADTSAAAMLAVRLTDEAWAVRTGQKARDVSREQFDRFHEMLAGAERVTADSVAHDDSDPAVWTQRLTIARGLEMGQAEAQRRYDQVAARTRTTCRHGSSCCSSCARSGADQWRRCTNSPGSAPGRPPRARNSRP